MKKAKRIIVLVLVSLLCLSLCSCQAIDDLRAQHAIFQEDGSILWNDAKYVPIRQFSDEIWSEYAIESYNSVYINITEADVPVLLAGYFGDIGYVYNDGELIYHTDDLTYERVYFCRTDRVDRVVAELDAIVQKLDEELVVYAYYYTYNNWEQDEELTYYLREEQKNAVDLVLTSVRPVMSDEVLTITWNVGLNACNYKDEWMEGGCLINLTTDGRYYFSGVNGTQEIYWVPEELYPIMDSIFEPLWIENEVEPEYWPQRDNA